MSDDKNAQFEAERAANIARLRDAHDLRRLSREWFDESARCRYSYNFSWLGRPIIQYPQDIVAMQELVWKIRPDLIVETGIAHGGSLVFYASMLELLGGDGRVLGIDVDIRPHNRAAIEAHPMYRRIDLLQGSSVDDAVVADVRRRAAGRERVLVVLDSNHTHAHVLAELRAYAPLVRRGSYLVVFDTVVEDMPADAFTDRPWGPGDNPKTAVHSFLQENDHFEIDHDIDTKLLVTVAPDGFLRCIKD
ncbi:MAG: cephalosporin hydroxylase family protein [Gammaproteobacteria bacterium]|nr:cephalosporin hydroxylase family protein [Gammaproteobacteria bacterium]